MLLFGISIGNIGLMKIGYEAMRLKIAVSDDGDF